MAVHISIFSKAYNGFREGHVYCPKSLSAVDISTLYLTIFESFSRQDLFNVLALLTGMREDNREILPQFEISVAITHKIQ